MLSTCVYSKSLINYGNFKKYYDSIFGHMGIIFEYIAERDFLVHWIDKPIIYFIANIAELNKKVFGVILQ
jgi:hypothetical protein